MRIVVALLFSLSLVGCSYEYMGLQTSQRAGCYTQYCTNARENCLLNSYLLTKFLPECSREGASDNDFFTKLYCDTDMILWQCAGAQEACYESCNRTYPLY